MRMGLSTYTSAAIRRPYTSAAIRRPFWSKHIRCSSRRPFGSSLSVDDVVDIIFTSRRPEGSSLSVDDVYDIIFISRRPEGSSLPLINRPIIKNILLYTHISTNIHICRHISTPTYVKLIIHIGPRCA